MDEKMLIEAMRQMMAEQSKQMADMMDAKLQTALEPIVEEQRHIRVLLEHTDKRVDALAEGQTMIREKVKKLDKVAEDVEEIKIKVSALENVTKDNTAQIKNIRIVK